MKKRFHLFIIILTIGMFLVPNLSYAGEATVATECCCNENSTEDVEKGCCNSNPSDDRGCGGNCGDSNCNTISIIYCIVSLNEIEIENNDFDFSNEKQRFYYTETFISDGFSSIWQPPKIV